MVRTGRARREVERLWPLIVLAAVLVGIVLLATLAPGSIQRVVTQNLILLIVVVGTYIFVGNSGLLSFGHINFMAIGAYVTAWLTIVPETKEFLLPDLPGFLARAEWSAVPAAIAAGAVASAFAFIVGLPLMRLSGIAASIGTFAVLSIVNNVFSNWDSMTGGASSLFGLTTYTNMYVALAWALIAIVAAFIYQESRFGFRLRGSREDHVAASVAGVNIHRERMIAFVLSAFFVGIGGVLQAHFLGIVVASAFFLNLTFLTIVMLVIGGMNSLSGAVVGVIAVSVMTEFLRRFEQGVDLGLFSLPVLPGLQEVVLAGAMLLILIFRPKGITGGREIPLPRFLRGSDSSPPGLIGTNEDVAPGDGATSKN